MILKNNLKRTQLKKNLKKILIPIISTTVPVALIYFSQKHFDFSLALKNITNINSTSIWMCLLLLLASRVFQAMRFQALYPAQLNSFFHTGISLTAQFVNAVVPMRGGELVRPFYLIKMGKDAQLSSIVVATFVDKVVEAICLIPFIFLGFFLYRQTLEQLITQKLGDFNQTWFIWATVFIISMSVFTLSFLKKKRPQLIADLKNNSKKIPLSLGFGLLHWLFFSLGFYFIIGDAKTSVLVSLASNFASAVPIAPGSLGIFEGAFIWSSKIAGSSLSNEMLLAQAMVVHFFYLIIPIAGGTLFFIKFGIPKKNKT